MTSSSSQGEKNEWQHQLVATWRENHSEEQVSAKIQQEIDDLIDKVERQKQEEEGDRSKK
jgi:hypothetical protein